ncbi:N-carbamoyl-L-amino-acid hydrolase [Amycolatopsis bartoniae]|uniref:Zn-dependent hydrolase n=1 Tax=Amycolatopsis bartoniae TaxID=941986 RepID=A0A8H9J0Y2_9PSEU|nr:allantoate amidohydrolase [Amycolatopsis bartoniae]MBB2938756.1 N-carbamoyl-L-amino-acid hydrolase [Amycolatopsis bartoniae]TVT11466.1 allantoate amidohydrolase [Amycolatopsis bartoniae]GHF79936.1 Zn-dependent hydrolase [Amycolatopsis bartoniae]
MSAVSLLGEIADVGRDRVRGGYSRHLFDPAERELREWFTEQARRRGLDVETDRNGNLWAWLGEPGPNAFVTGSHLDSVPGGGAFDGPLGVVSALDAVTALEKPNRPVAVIAFAEEEGGRFGVPCLGSQLLTGAIDPARALALRDPDGVTFAEVTAQAGLEPGRDDEALGRIGTFLELHVEQGRGLVDLGSPLAVGSTVIAHGRWRFTFTGQGNHAGATRITDRHDPMLPAAAVVAAARRLASKVEGARATVGRLVPKPGGTNVIASTVDLWLDARVPSDDRVRPLVDEIAEAASRAAAEEGCEVKISEESYSRTATFDTGLREQLRDLLGGAPELPTGAGHDAAILAAHVPAGMLYVRNPTGVSHAPEEFAEDDDVERGARALADVLRHLST